MRADAPYGLDDLNLDGMTEYDLRVTAIELRRLAHYADAKLLAMKHRLAGRVEKAQHYEALCENIHKAIPPNWRW